MKRQIRPPTIDELLQAAPFQCLEDLVADSFSTMKAANRMTVTEAAQEYTRIGSGGGYSKPWSVEKTPYLREPQDVMTSLDYQGAVFVGPARTGKALAIDTEIPTPEGWLRLAQLNEGDEVFGPDGKPTRITFATETMFGHKCYRVEFADGSKIVADADHIWEVRDIRKSDRKPCIVLKTTAEMLREGLVFGKTNRLRFAIKTPDPVQYEPKELPLDPYVLGMWLGDGSRINCTIAVGAQDLYATMDNLHQRGYAVRVYKPSSIRRCFSLVVRGPDGVCLDQYISTMGFEEHMPKHIPEDYMTASEDQRRELLRGLCDTDGSIFGTNGRHVQFVTVDMAFAKQVKELVASLGYKVSMRTKKSFIGKKRYRDAYSVDFNVYDPSECFALPRKAKMSVTTAKRRETWTGNRFIKAIVPVDSVPVRCIKVDREDGLFLAGRDYIVTHNTVMGLNFLAHTIMTDPADMLFVHMDRENARKWSNGDLNRFLMASTAIRAEQMTSRQYDNTFDKTFKSGMRFLLTYPTASNLSGITVGRVMFIDYDRMDDDVDGEGNPYDLGSMRTTTFKRFAMTVAESSPNPNKEIQDPRWIPETPHAAPPIRGIFELYNRGDRRRWQWPCPQCGEYFEPDFSLLHYGDTSDPMEARDNTTMICPHNGCVIHPREKDALNMKGKWVRDGEAVLPSGEIVTRPGMKVARSSIASFWLKGPAAAYQDWGQLVEKYLRAMRALEETGDDGPLRKTVTTDQGSFYVPQSRLSDVSPEQLMNRAEDWGSTPENPTVPEGVRVLTATVDVQKSAFVVQVNGLTATNDLVVVDAFKVRLSNRLNANGERLPIDPAAYGEDWHVLEAEVMNKSYELADGSGRRMRIRATACDSGGAEGVTGHAYNFWRKLRGEGNGDHRRFILVKGDTSRTAPRARTTWPDSSQKDKFAVARGDVPVVMFNPNSLKDLVFLMMSRRVAEDDEGGGMLRYPDWLENWFYVQLTSEIREEKGWKNSRKRRNESFDLCYYALGIAFRPLETGVPYIHFGLDRIDTNSPPTWFGDWDVNEFIYHPDGSTPPDAPQKRKTLADLASKLA